MTSRSIASGCDLEMRSRSVTSRSIASSYGQEMRSRSVTKGQSDLAVIWKCDPI
ncbi:hypothetical protein [Moorena producens]|uniref:hypothetical protein n=1 Tax=Moorena producens TaxID=1155739 RepID=UPI003C738506